MRFRLRTLLIVVTIFASALGMLRWWRRPFVIGHIESATGKVDTVTMIWRTWPGRFEDQTWRLDKPLPEDEAESLMKALRESGRQPPGIVDRGHRHDATPGSQERELRDNRRENLVTW
jgi:hypothetical protein